MSTDAATDTIVFVHGLWVTARSWDTWSEHYARAGLRTFAPAWVGLEAEVEALRADPSPLVDLGLREVIDHYEDFILGLDRPPILMGHSTGGAIVQVLLDRGLGACGVVLHSVPVKRALLVPPVATLKALGGFLANPANIHRVMPMTPAKFHQIFTNAMDERAAQAAYDRYYIPASGRVIFQSALSLFDKRSPLAVRFDNEERAPLLFVSGGVDRLLPAQLQRRNHRLYLGSRAVTEYVEIADRCHFTMNQAGWEPIADSALEWALAHATGAMRAEQPSVAVGELRTHPA